MLQYREIGLYAWRSQADLGKAIGNNKVKPQESHRKATGKSQENLRKISGRQADSMKQQKD